MPSVSSTLSTVVNSGDVFLPQYRLVRDMPVSRAIFDMLLARATFWIARKMSLLSKVWNASAR